MRILMTVAVVCSLASAPVAQSTEGAVYRSQYVELKAKAVGLIERTANSRQNAPALRNERLALLKLIHRLQEVAMSDNATRGKSGQPSDKTLLLVSQGCSGLDFLLLALDSYLDTGDRAFLGLARESITLLNSTEKFF